LTGKWEYSLPLHVGHIKGSLRREVYTHECQHKKTGVILNKKLGGTPQTLKKQKQAKPKISTCKEIMKIRT
jgi:hypothetical protein